MPNPTNPSKYKYVCITEEKKKNTEHLKLGGTMRYHLYYQLIFLGHRALSNVICLSVVFSAFILGIWGPHNMRLFLQWWAAFIDLTFPFG